MAIRRSRQFWARQLAAAESSGMTKAAYCRQHGLDYRTFYRWFRRMGDAATAPAASQALVPIAVRAPSPMVQPPAMTLRIGADVSLSIPTSVDAGWLATLMRAASAC
jgi:transposase-like protein